MLKHNKYRLPRSYTAVSPDVRRQTHAAVCEGVLDLQYRLALRQAMIEECQSISELSRVLRLGGDVLKFLNLQAKVMALFLVPNKDVVDRSRRCAAIKREAQRIAATVPRYSSEEVELELLVRMYKY